MHEIGVSVIWLSLQVTIVALGAALFYWCIRSRGPVLRSLVISSSLIVTLLLAMLVLSPWPRWRVERWQQGHGEITPVEKSIHKKASTDLSDSSLPKKKDI